MTTRAFIIRTALWLFILLLAASDLGAMLGFALAFGFAMFGGATAAIAEVVLREMGYGDLGSQIGPGLLLGVLGLLFALCIMRALFLGARRWSAGERDAARAEWARAVSLFGFAAAGVLSVAALERTWPA